MKIETKLVGVTFEPAKTNFKKLKLGQKLTLVPYVFEKEGCKTDKYAVKVMNGEEMCGHIASPLNKTFHKKEFNSVKVSEVMYIDQEYEEIPVGSDNMDVEVVKKGKNFNTEGRGEVCSVKIEAEIVDVLPQEKPIKKKSYNEDIEVDFYPIAHQYWYKGKQLQSVTRFIKPMFSEFNAKAISERCATSWEMKAKDIEDMWSANADASASFGTGLHAFMENYERYGERALPKMPILKDIVTSFPWDNNTYEVEVLITDIKNNLCGLVDRLQIGLAKARVEDYKFNYGSEDVKTAYKCSKYPDLPKTKITKYQVQMSVYAKMLENTGHDVDDYVTAHVWDGEWHHHKLERLKDIF